MLSMSYTDINAKTIDRWVEEGWEWGTPITHEKYQDALEGKWEMLLTPTKPVPKEWFPSLKGKRILGLASGGGQQMPIFAALGAKCTVMDISKKQIENELLVAKREGYEIEAIIGDMTKPFPFEDESFDVIFHPVANCYIKDVAHVWRECARVLKKGGILMAGLDNGFNYLFEEDDESRVVNTLPFDPLSDEEKMKQLIDGDYGVQFSHSISEQIADQIKAGLELLDIYDDTNGSGYLHEHGVPCFYATLARKK